MSFISEAKQGKSYAPGYFLASEDCERETREIAQTGATTVGTDKVVKMGTFYPANDASIVEGIVYEDVDVTNGDMPGSVVTKGTVYVTRLPVAPEDGVLTALAAKGFKFITYSSSIVPISGSILPVVPPVTRPY